MVQRQFFNRQVVRPIRDISRPTSQEVMVVPQRTTYESYSAPQATYTPETDKRRTSQPTENYVPFERILNPDGTVTEITRDVYEYYYNPNSNVPSRKRIYVSKEVRIDPSTGERVEKTYGVIGSGKKSKIKLIDTKTYYDDVKVSEVSNRGFEKSKSLARISELKREISQTTDKKEQDRLINQYKKLKGTYRQEFNIPVKQVKYGTARVTDIKYLGKAFEKAPKGTKFDILDLKGKKVGTTKYIEATPSEGIQPIIDIKQKRAWSNAFAGEFFDIIEKKFYEDIKKITKEETIATYGKKMVSVADKETYLKELDYSQSEKFLSKTLGYKFIDLKPGSYEEIQLSITKPGRYGYVPEDNIPELKKDSYNSFFEPAKTLLAVIVVSKGKYTGKKIPDKESIKQLKILGSDFVGGLPLYGEQLKELGRKSFVGVQKEALGIQDYFTSQIISLTGTRVFNPLTNKTKKEVSEAYKQRARKYVTSEEALVAQELGAIAIGSYFLPTITKFVFRTMAVKAGAGFIASPSKEKSAEFLMYATPDIIEKFPLKFRGQEIPIKTKVKTTEPTLVTQYFGVSINIFGKERLLGGVSRVERFDVLGKEYRATRDVQGRFTKGQASGFLKKYFGYEFRKGIPSDIFGDIAYDVPFAKIETISGARIIGRGLRSKITKGNEFFKTETGDVGVYFDLESFKIISEATYKLGRKRSTGFASRGAFGIRRAKLTYETRTLSIKGVEYVVKTLRKYGKLFGSFPTRPQLIKYLRNRVPGDIDFTFSRSVNDAMAEIISKDLAKGLTKVEGKKIRVSEQRPTLLEDAKGNHVVDLHTAYENYSGAVLPETGFAGVSFDQYPLKFRGGIFGSKAVPISEQIGRKGASILTLRSEKQMFSKYQGLSRKQIKQGLEFHHTNYKTKEGFVLTKKQHKLIHDLMIGKKKITPELRDFYNKYKIIVKPQQKLFFAPEAHRFKDVGDFFDATETVEMRRLFGSKEYSRLQELRRSLPEELRTSAKPSFEAIEPTGRRSLFPSTYTAMASYFVSPKAILSISRSIITKPSVSRSISRSVSPSVSRSVSVSVSRYFSPSISRYVSQSMSRSVSRSVSPSVSRSVSRSVSPSVSRSVSRSTSRSRSRSVSRSVSRSRSRSRSRSVSRYNYKYKIKYPTKIRPPADIPEEYPMSERKRSYNVFVRDRAKNKRIKGKLLRANIKPLSLAGAYGLGSYITDNTTARTFTVNKARGKPNKSKYENYYKTYGYKFRKPVFKGRTNLNSALNIEKVRHLIDTKGEKKQLSAYRLIAKINKRKRR